MAKHIVVILMFSLVLTVLARYQPYRCEPVMTPMCRELDPKNYVQTSYPNFMNQTSYLQVNDELEQFDPLIDSGCSNVMKMFLCSLYVPMCKPGFVKRIPPCRSLCEEARRGCKPLLDSAYIKWPESMNCDQFPKEGHGLCINPPKEVITKQTELTIPKTNSIPSKSRSLGKVSVLFATGSKTTKGIQLKCEDSNKQIFVRKLRFRPHHRATCKPSQYIKTIAKICNGQQECTIDYNTIKKECMKNVGKNNTIVILKYKCLGKKDRTRVKKK